MASVVGMRSRKRVPFAHGPTMVQIELVYEGQNGVSFELGWAVRPAPSDTPSTF